MYRLHRRLRDPYHFEALWSFLGFESARARFGSYDTQISWSWLECFATMTRDGQSSVEYAAVVTYVFRLVRKMECLKGWKMPSLTLSCALLHHSMDLLIAAPLTADGNDPGGLVGATGNQEIRMRFITNWPPSQTPTHSLDFIGSMLFLKHSPFPHSSTLCSHALSHSFASNGSPPSSTPVSRRPDITLMRNR